MYAHILFLHFMTFLNPYFCYTRSSMANCNYKIVFDSDSIYRIPNFLSHTYFYNTDIPFYQEKFQKFSKFFWKFNFFYQKIEFFVNIDLAELYTPYKTFISNVPTQYYQNSQLFEWLKKMIFSVKHDHLSFKIHYDFIKQIISSFIL